MLSKLHFLEIGWRYHQEDQSCHGLSNFQGNILNAPKTHDYSVEMSQAIWSSIVKKSLAWISKHLFRGKMFLLTLKTSSRAINGSIYLLKTEVKIRKKEGKEKERKCHPFPEPKLHLELQAEEKTEHKMVCD